MHVHIVLLLWCEKGIVYQQVIRTLVYYSYLFTKFHTSKHLGKRVTQHACSHCFLLWCKNSIVYQQVIRMLVLYIINPYQFTKFHTSKHLSKRVTQTCMFTLFWCEKGIVYPTSYQNVGVVSVFPTCLPSFMHRSILVRELHKLACPIVMYGPKLFIVVIQKVRCLPKL